MKCDSPILTCAILTSEAEIEALAGEWRELHARAGRSPFSDYDWFMVWWRTLGKTRDAQSLHVIAGREDGRLAGVLPLIIERKMGLRIMRGGGHKAFYYCDMLCESTSHAARLWDAARRSPHYHFADIRDVYPESMCYPALSSFAQRRDVIEAYYLRSDWPSGKDWLASLPGKFTKIMRRRLRRLEEKGQVRFEVYQDGPLPKDIIAAMVEQKIIWSRARKKPGLFGHPNVIDYFQRLFEIAAAQGNLMLGWLKCGDETIAYTLNLTYGKVLHGYVITYDPAWRAYAPGIQIMASTIGWAIDNGYRGVNQRQGGGDYKNTFSNEMSNCDEFTFSGSFPGRMIEAGFFGLRSAWRLLRGAQLAPVKQQTEE